jgi:hypothetical protein
MAENSLELSSSPECHLYHFSRPNPRRYHHGQRHLSRDDGESAPGLLRGTGGRKNWIQIFIFREGPVPPDKEYMEQILEQRSPDALEDKAELIGVPLFPQPENIEFAAKTYLVNLQREQKLKFNLSNVEYVDIKDGQGNRVFVAKVMKPQPGVVKESLTVNKNR